MIPTMIGFLDAHYDEAAGTAAAACVVVAAWTDVEPAVERRVVTPLAAPYESGALYRRELPALLAVLAVLPMITPLSVLVVDGHAWLADGRPGLGAHLYEALGRCVPVVGVAKRAHVGAPAIAVQRGTSQRPLWVGAVGMDPARAAAQLAAIPGPHRLPELSRRVDHLARGFIAPR